MVRNRKLAITNYLAATIFFAALLGIYGQDSVSAIVRPKAERIVVDDHIIPIFKGVKEVEVIREPNQVIRVRYNISVRTMEKMFSDFEKMKKFYSGTTIFGVKIAQFSEDSPATFKSCNANDQPSLYILVGPQSGGYINFVEIANKCFEETN